MEELIDREAEFKRSKRRKNFAALALLSPYILIFLLFNFIPFIMGFVFSFMKYNPYMSGNNQFIGFTNYINLFDYSQPVSQTFWKSFATMLVFDLVMVPTLIIVPLALAYLVNMHPPGYKFFRAMLYLPSVISISIMGIVFGNMFAGTESGYINSLLNTKIEWLAGQPFAGDTLRWVVIFIASIWWQTGTNFVIFLGALRDVPKSLYEACEMDGGNRFRRIMHVMLPSIKPSVAICLFNTLISYLGLYGQPYVLNDISNSDVIVSPMMFIQHYLTGGVTYARLTGLICAAAIIFGIIVMLFGIAERRLMGERKRNDKFVAAYKLSQKDLKRGLLLRNSAQAAPEDR